MRLTLITPPVALPVSLEEAKKHCRVEAEDTDEDTLIEGLIAGAVDLLDGPSGILGRAIVTQVWLLELPSFPDVISLPIEPVQSVAVSYWDSDGVEQALSAEAYDLINAPSRRTQMKLVSGVSLPALQDTSFPVRISITAGFGAAAQVPPALQVVIKMIVGMWFEHREAIIPTDMVGGWPAPIRALLARWRVML